MFDCREDRDNADSDADEDTDANASAFPLSVLNKTEIPGLPVPSSLICILISDIILMYSFSFFVMRQSVNLFVTLLFCHFFLAPSNRDWNEILFKLFKGDE